MGGQSIKSVCLFTIAGQRYALEAETGTSSAAKVGLKVRRYARLLERGARVHLVFHCATNLHAHTVSQAIAATVGAFAPAMPLISHTRTIAESQFAD